MYEVEVQCTMYYFNNKYSILFAASDSEFDFTSSVIVVTSVLEATGLFSASGEMLTLESRI